MLLALRADGLPAAGQPGQTLSSAQPGGDEAGGQAAGRGFVERGVASSVLYLAGSGFVTDTVLECTGGANLPVGR